MVGKYLILIQTRVCDVSISVWSINRMVGAICGEAVDLSLVRGSDSRSYLLNEDRSTAVLDMKSTIPSTLQNKTNKKILKTIASVQNC